MGLQKYVGQFNIVIKNCDNSSFSFLDTAKKSKTSEVIQIKITVYQTYIILPLSDMPQLLVFLNLKSF